MLSLTLATCQRLSYMLSVILRPFLGGKKGGNGAQQDGNMQL